MDRSTAQLATDVLAVVMQATERTAKAAAEVPETSAIAANGEALAWFSSIGQAYIRIAEYATTEPDWPLLEACIRETARRLTAEAAGLLAEQPQAVQADRRPTQSEQPTEAASHVVGAESIRSDVAAFRQRLREEQADRARRAAAERRRFVERLRGQDETSVGEAAREIVDGPEQHESRTEATVGHTTQQNEFVVEPQLTNDTERSATIRFRQRRTDESGQAHEAA